MAKVRLRYRSIELLGSVESDLGVKMLEVHSNPGCRFGMVCDVIVVNIGVFCTLGWEGARCHRWWLSLRSSGWLSR